MKKLLSLALAVCGFIILSSCKGNPAGQNFTNFVEDFGPKETASGPWAEDGPVDYYRYDNANFSDRLSFDVISYPNSKEYKAENFYVIADWFGQIEYRNPEGERLVLRVAEKGLESPEEAYAESHYIDRTKYEFAEITVVSKLSEENCGILIWEKDEYRFTLHAKDGSLINEETAKTFFENTSCG